MTMHQLTASTLAASALLLAHAAGPAAAAAPTPRGPAAGCGQGFSLQSVEDLEARFREPVPARFDSNLDGLLCFRPAPPTQTGAFNGILVDNTAVGQP